MGASRPVSVWLTLGTPLMGGPPGGNWPAPTMTIGLPLAQAARSALKVYSVPTCAPFTLRNQPTPQLELGGAKKSFWEQVPLGGPPMGQSGTGPFAVVTWAPLGWKPSGKLTVRAALPKPASVRVTGTVTWLPARCRAELKGGVTVQCTPGPPGPG